MVDLVSNKGSVAYSCREQRPDIMHIVLFSVSRVSMRMKAAPSLNIHIFIKIVATNGQPLLTYLRPVDPALEREVGVVRDEYRDAPEHHRLEHADAPGGVAEGGEAERRFFHLLPIPG